jgi:putative sigma-54 modulation protein
VRTKKFPIKPMSCEEAVLQMNLVDHTFFAFKNIDDDGAFAVVYKRVPLLIYLKYYHYGY